MPRRAHLTLLISVILGAAAAACEAGTTLGAQQTRTSTAVGLVPNPNMAVPSPSTSPNVSISPNVPQSPNMPKDTNGVLPASPGIAIYWGTGNGSGKDPNLETVCATPHYSIVIVSFAHAIGMGSRNAGGLPETQISGCSGNMPAPNQYLQDCSNLAPAIAACQAAGKQVILSLGGGGAKVGFKSDAEGQAYAALLWDAVLGGKGAVRPFGAATLDGIDLDVESGSAVGYGAFVLALRAKMDADTRKKYIITAAPQCPFPDVWMGPGVGTALTMGLTAFDHLFVQFYNNYCRWAEPEAFMTTYGQWTTLGTGVQPKIWVGLPAASNAAMKEDMVSVATMPALIKAASASPNYGGIMLWDAGYDIIDAAPGAATYSAGIAAAQATVLGPVK